MDKLWFYTKSGSSEKQGPVSDDEMRGLISDGSIARGDLLWSEGMSEWKPLASIDELKDLISASAGSAGGTSAGTAVAVPDGLTGWMGFVGIVTILGGISQCLSCVGVVTGIFLIVGGAALMAAKNAIAGVAEVEPAIGLFLQKIKTFMMMTGIVYIVVLVSFVLLFVFSNAIIAALIAATGTTQ